jgi:hypothetical protein
MIKLGYKLMSEEHGPTDRPQTETDRPPEARGDPSPRHRGRAGARDRAQLQRRPTHDFAPRPLDFVSARAKQPRGR